jgi:leader peptidase (prepilin peptidase) / N-methyltransferase
MSELAAAFAATPWLLAAFVFVLSLLVGSFLNVVIHRLPIMLEREWKAQAREMLADSAHDGDPRAADGQLDLPGLEPGQSDVPVERYNLVVPRSRCPRCEAPITALQNIPVLSWLWLRGRCANCQVPIPARYPVVEIVTAVLSAAVALRFGWHWQTAAALVFTWALVALTVIDLDHTLLPDSITLPLLWLGLLLSLFWQPGLAPPAPVDPRSALLGAACGYLLLWTVYWAFKLVTGKEGMGYGDFKLLGALGAWMGWQMLPLILLFSALTGAVVGIGLILLRGRDRNVPMPFGPYLAAAGWIALLWGPQIVGGYLALAGLGR